jgi:membrane-bound serine protease (ClpP class)
MKNIISIQLILFALLLWAIPLHSEANTDSTTTSVYTFEMKEMIAPPVWRTTKNAMEEAVAQKADLIIIHMNTYGGTLDDADSIRTKILSSPIPVYVFIDKNAASAGALISIACDSIYMAPGSSIGAATVVNQSGEQMPDKYQSYMRSMMRATAEAQHRDPDIAQAMVDPKIYVPGVSDSGQVLTFTVSEAIKFGFCEGEMNSIKEVLDHAGVQNYTLIKHHLSATDKVIGWLINPFFSGILIMIIIGGIYFELQTPGVGFPLAAAFIAALLYFAPLYLEGMAAHWEILVFIVGVILIAVEIFAIPGFGVTGVLGLILMITGLTLSMVDNIDPGNFNVSMMQITKALTVVVIAFFLAITGSIYLSKRLFTSHAFGHLALKKTQQKGEGYTSASSVYQSMIGREGLAYTTLRPAGKVMIDNELFDATARTGLIDKGETIRVVGYSSAQLVVKKG